MSQGLPRWVHRDLPRSAAPDSWRSLRYARVPPMDYLDKPPINECGPAFNRRRSAKWVSIQPALTREVAAAAVRENAGIEVEADQDQSIFDLAAEDNPDAADARG